MRFHVTPDFSKKLSQLRPGSLQRLATFVATVERADAEQVLEQLSTFSVRAMEGGIYVANAGSARIFFSFGGEGEAKYLLLVDVLDYEPASSSVEKPRRKSPITDTKLNPNVNTKINPYVNSRLNPFVNSRINPYVNSRLNPFVNSQLNPIVNSRLNPLVNSRLNPLVNSRLNPLANTTINPMVNPGYEGPFLYDLALKNEGFTVNASEGVILLFNDRNERIGLGVKNAAEGYTLFDSSNAWIGQFIPDGQGGYLRYDKDNKWVGIVV